MKSQELRIGNFVQAKLLIPVLGNTKYLTVSSVEIRDCEHYKENWSYEPIPLTEEWLVRLGFVYEDLGDDTPYEWYVKDGMQIWNFNNQHWICDMLDQNRFNQDDFKHVHQLQNLYFALTGEELTIKP
jgi:hypothetical protein